MLLKTNNDYRLILNELNNKMFPFHDRDKYITCQRFYYWLKQHNVHKFKNLNNELKELVNNYLKLQSQNS